MKLKLYFAAMSVSVLLTACQHTQTSKPEAAETAPMTAPAVPVAPAPAEPAAMAAPAVPAEPAVVAAPVVASTPASSDEIIIDNGDASPSFTSAGSWTSGAGGNDFKDGSAYASATATGETANTATWTPDIKNAGAYDVYEWHGDDPNSDHATKAPFTVKSDDGTKTIIVNLQTNSGKWNLLGTFNFAAANGGNVSLTSSGADGNVLADAVKFVPHH